MGHYAGYATTESSYPKQFKMKGQLGNNFEGGMDWGCIKEYDKSTTQQGSRQLHSHVSPELSRNCAKLENMPSELYN